MSRESKIFSRYASAEKEFGEIAGTVLAAALRDIQDRNGIKISEVRVTVDPQREGADCTFVREADLENDVHVAMRATGV